MTIYDIAREAGVSASSVSRVINNKPGVNPKTREKIRILLERYRYTPNKTAQELITSDSRLVGILVADVRTQHHTEGAYYISREMNERGYHCLILNTGDSDEERAEGIRMLRRRNVSAAVLMGSIFQSAAVEAAILEYLPDSPVFILNGYIDLPNVYGVLSDDRTGVEDCVKLLMDKGRYQLAFLSDKPTPSSRLKEEGFVRAMSRLGLKRRDLWIYTGVDGSPEGGRAVCRQILNEHPQVDGFVCSLDIIGCGVLQELEAAGRRVPQDAAVIGIDNSLYAEICKPRLTSLDTMILDSGVTIAHKLIDVLEGRRTTHKTLLFTSIAEREST